MSDTYDLWCAAGRGSVTGARVLFAVMAFLTLCSARLGCCVGGKYVGRIMYADDVITLSVSLNMLQRMLTKSQAVARIADRTASQDSSNYNDCVIRPSIL